MDGAITEFFTRRMFNSNVGELFIMPTGRSTLCADIIVFAGLDYLMNSMMSCCGLLQRMWRTLVHTYTEEFATVMIGTGSGTDMQSSLNSLVQGFFRGLKDVDTNQRVRMITLCEMDAVRYEQMKNEILRLSTTSLFDDVEATISEIHLPPAPAYRQYDERALVTGFDPAYLFVRRA